MRDMTLRDMTLRDRTDVGQDKSIARKNARQDTNRQDRCRTGQKHDWIDAGPDGWRTKDGCKTGLLQDRMDLDRTDEGQDRQRTGQRRDRMRQDG